MTSAQSQLSEMSHALSTIAFFHQSKSAPSRRWSLLFLIWRDVSQLTVVYLPPTIALCNNAGCTNYAGCSLIFTNRSETNRFVQHLSSFLPSRGQTVRESSEESQLLYDVANSAHVVELLLCTCYHENRSCREIQIVLRRKQWRHTLWKNVGGCC